MYNFDHLVIRHQNVINGLQKYTGIMLVISTIKDIKKGRANDALCREISIKLKKMRNYIGRSGMGERCHMCP